MAHDENDLGPDDEQLPEAEEPLPGPAETETVPATHGAALQAAHEPPPSYEEDPGPPVPEGKRPSRFSRRGKIIFSVTALLLLIGGGAAGGYILYEQHQAKICAEARKTSDPAKLAECWSCSTQKQWRPVVIHHISKTDQTENLPIVMEALGMDDYGMVKEGANALLFMAQSPDAAVRTKVAALKDAMKQRMKALAAVDDVQAQQSHALLGLTLLYLQDIDGLAPSLVNAPQFGFDAYSGSLIGWLANHQMAFYDAVLKLSEKADTPLMIRVLGALEAVNYSGDESETQSKRTRTIDLLKKVLASPQTEGDLEVQAIMTWAETGDEGALQRVAEYFDRAATLENAEVVSDREMGLELARRAEQIFNKVKLRYGAEKLVDLYKLIKKNRHRKERILYLVRQLHDPRQKIRDFLLEAVENYAPEDGDFGSYLNDEDQLTHKGTQYINAVFALAELLDERAVAHLKGVLNKFNTMVKITDEQANLYNAGLLILGSIGVRQGPPLEEEVAKYIFELSDPDKYPERWAEKRAGKLRVLSFLAADLWDRFLAERPECKDDIDAVTGLPKPNSGCPTAVDLVAELPPPPPGPDGQPVEVEAPEPVSEYEELPEMVKRRERLREFAEGAKTLDETKHEELRWVFDSGVMDVKQKIYYFTKVFTCPIEITMVQAMMDRNDPKVKAMERWCGDYSPAAESLARLAHNASASFRREARQFLGQRLDKTFLRYPDTNEPIQYDQYMNQQIYTYVRFRQAMAKSLGYLGDPDPKLIEILRTVTFDEFDHPQVGLYAGTSLGIIADGPTLDAIVDGFVSVDTHPDLRGYLLKALDGHFRFAPLNDLAPSIPDAESRAISKLVAFLSTYQGGLKTLPANRLYLLGALFGSIATTNEIGSQLASLVRGPDARIREIALLALICSASPEAAGPIFDEVYGAAPPDANVATLKTHTVLKTLRDIYANVGTPNDPYTIMVRSGNEIENQAMFRRLEVLHKLAELDQREFLDYYTMRMTLALGVDKDAYDKAVQEAGLEAADSYTPLAYKLSYSDNFTYYETPYLTWIDKLYNFARDPAANLQYRKYVVELLWKMDERGFVYSIFADTATDSSSADDQKLHDFVYERVMREM
jgi:hypothetical protein